MWLIKDIDITFTAKAGIHQKGIFMFLLSFDIHYMLYSPTCLPAPSSASSMLMLRGERSAPSSPEAKPEALKMKEGHY